MDYSFYGGRPGAAFILKATYKSYLEMEAAFKEPTCIVNYGEYVLLNTVNKADPVNGDIYKRTRQGAEYIGNIAGAPGGVSEIQITTYEEAEELLEGHGRQQDLKLDLSKTGEVDTIHIISGTIKNATNEDAMTYIGMDIPAIKMGLSGELVDLNYAGPVVTQNNNQKPFSQNWTLHIPQGYLVIMEANSNITNCPQKAITNKNLVFVYKYKQFNSSHGYQEQLLYVGDYHMINEVSLDEDGIFKITYVNEPETKAYQTLLKWVKDIIFDNDGTVTIKYSGGKEDVKKQNLIKWINQISLDSDTGSFETQYNYGDPYTASLNWVKDIEFNDNGTVTINYTVNEPKVKSNLLKWIDKVQLNTDTGEFNVFYNTNKTAPGYTTFLKWPKEISIKENGTIETVYSNNTSVVQEKFIKWIKNIELDGETGSFKLLYNTDDPNVPSIATTLNWIKEVALDENGLLKFTSTTGEEKSFTLRQIENISIDTGTQEGEGTQKVKIKYNTDEEETLIGQPLNYIINTVLTSDYHLLVYYSDPEKRKNVPESRQYKGIDPDYINKGYDDLGIVKDYSGILIGTAFSYQEIAETYHLDSKFLVAKNNVIDFLYQKYQNDPGKTIPALRGKVIAIVDSSERDPLPTSLYAIDYKLSQTNNAWSYIGILGESGGSAAGTIIGKEGDAETDIRWTELPVRGIWFVVD